MQANLEVILEVHGGIYTHHRKFVNMHICNVRTEHAHRHAVRILQSYIFLS